MKGKLLTLIFGVDTKYEIYSINIFKYCRNENGDIVPNGLSRRLIQDFRGGVERVCAWNLKL